MNIEQFQKDSLRTQKSYKQLEESDLKKLDMALGLSGEVGEVVDLVKHAIFHNEKLERCELAKELGDVMWYLVNMASAYDMSMEDILLLNEAKLAARYSEGYSDEASKNRHATEFSLKDTFANLERNRLLYGNKKEI